MTLKFTKAGLAPLLKSPLSFCQGLSDEDLVALYQKLQHTYYNSDKPLVSDDIFDVVQTYIRKRLPKHPILKSVGAVIGDDDKRKEALPVYMGSLNKVKSDPKVLDTFKTKYPGSYMVSDKLDGNSALYVFGPEDEKPKLFTRGNGEIGQNISHIIPFISGIPSGTSKTRTIVRGELIMSKQLFAKYGKGANARNTVAGLVNAKVPDLEIAKNTTFVAYTLIQPQVKPSAQVAALNKMKFHVVHTELIKEPNMTFEHLSNLLVSRRDQSDFEIDGLVVAHDGLHPINTHDNPDDAFAFKHLLMLQTAEVIVTGIEWSLSKDGLIKPVVLFDPVKLSGVHIQRATGFNAEYIKVNKIGAGARLLITRSGDVIPYIMETLQPAASGQGDLPSQAERPYTWVGKDIKVTGSSSEQDAKQLENFFDKMDVAGIRGGTSQKFFEAGFTTVKKFMDMSESDLADIPALKNKWTLVKAAHATIKSASCIKLMQASNAFGQGFGERKLKAILSDIPGIATNYTPTVDELIQVDGVSTLTATKFITGLAAFRRFVRETGLHCSKAATARSRSASPSGKATTSKATKANASNASKASAKANASFQGQVVVFTGFRNKEWAAAIEERGGEAGASVTKKTTLVVAKDPDDMTGKLKVAHDKGIKIIGQEEFEKMLS